MENKEFLGSSNLGNAERKQAQEPDLPKEYGDTKIIALVRDPLWIHTYWEINSRKIEDLKGMLGNEYESASLVLRVHEVTGLDFNGENSRSYFDINVDKQARSWYINVGNPDNEFVVDLGMMTSSGQFILIARSNRIKTPRADASQNIDEKWMLVEEHYSKIFEMSGGGKTGKGSADIMAQITKRLFSEMNMSSGTLSSASSDTIAAQKKVKEEEGFWFKVGTELIIYGETLPDAKVVMDDEEIKLRPDGSFSLRFELPDGNHEFPIKATSANGKHERKVKIIVTRDAE